MNQKLPTWMELVDMPAKRLGLAAKMRMNLSLDPGAAEHVATLLVKMATMLDAVHARMELEDAARKAASETDQPLD